MIDPTKFAEEQITKIAKYPPEYEKLQKEQTMLETRMKIEKDPEIQSHEGF